MGTPAYMAPEQAEGRSDEIGPHTDIWAMGIILHEMATGVGAFEGPSLPAILYAVCHGEPAPIATHRPDAPAAFVQLIADALTRPIAERLDDASVMRGRLREALRTVAGVDYSKMPVIRMPTPAPVARSRTDVGFAATLGNASTLGTAPALPAAAAVTDQPAPASKWPRVALLGLLAAGAAGAAVVLATRGDAPGDKPASTPVPVVAVVVSDAAPAEPALVVDAAGVTLATPDAAVPPDAAVRALPTRPVRPAAPASFVEQVTAAISRKMGVLGRCIEDHPSDGASDITATIEILPDGKASSVALAPAAVASSPLGACLRAGLLTVAYPPSAQGGKVAFPLRTRSR